MEKTTERGIWQRDDDDDDDDDIAKTCVEATERSMCMCMCVTLNVTVSMSTDATKNGQGPNFI